MVSLLNHGPFLCQHPGTKCCQIATLFGDACDKNNFGDRRVLGIIVSFSRVTSETLEEDPLPPDFSRRGRAIREQEGRCFIQ